MIFGLVVGAAILFIGAVTKWALNASLTVAAIEKIRSEDPPTEQARAEESSPPSFPPESDEEYLNQVLKGVRWRMPAIPSWMSLSSRERYAKCADLVVYMEDATREAHADGDRLSVYKYASEGRKQRNLAREIFEREERAFKKKSGADQRSYVDVVLSGQHGPTGIPGGFKDADTERRYVELVGNADVLERKAHALFKGGADRLAHAEVGRARSLRDAADRLRKGEETIWASDALLAAEPRELKLDDAVLEASG